MDRISELPDELLFSRHKPAIT
ncbi:BnaC08g26360D [Brassica napus]|uniref:BnaC08g26360D protein n=1 Tax=Brassica napus TaxID=3708 RepID=A0A078HTN8_BRANA|nr:BnaC08g26360D [Brassica napus]